jgi:histidinol-phosphate aminotransferase
MTTNRRIWLKQTTLAVAGLSATVHGFGFGKTYLPGENKIILSSNENPHGPSPMARKAMANAVILSNRYPWHTTTQLREKIAKRYELDKEHVLMGAGSSEILGLVAQYAALQKGNLIMANPTFKIWATAAEKSGLLIVTVPLTADKKHDLPAMLNSINNETKLVYICNPNNPTGTVLPVQEIKNFIETVSKKILVLLDEAYIDYSDEPTLAQLVTTHKNVVIAKTFSKLYGMAGARIGYALAHPEMIQQLSKLQPWENAGASAVSLAGALASLDDTDFIKKTKSLNAIAGAYTIKELEKLNIRVIPSHTNFIYLSFKDYAKDYMLQLRANNIIGGRIMEEEGKWSRITIGTPQEMKQYIAALQ